MESMRLSCQSCDVHMYLKKTRYRFLLALRFYLFAILDDAISSRLVTEKRKVPTRGLSFELPPHSKKQLREQCKVDSEKNYC